MATLTLIMQKSYFPFLSITLLSSILFFLHFFPDFIYSGVYYVFFGWSEGKLTVDQFEDQWDESSEFPWLKRCLPVRSVIYEETR